MSSTRKYMLGGLMIIIVMSWMLHPVYYSVAMEWERYEQQKFISEEIESDRYVEISMTHASFAQYYDREHKELNIDGEMYDLVRILGETGGQVHFIVLPDKKESKLISLLSHSVKHKKHRRSHSTHSFWLPIAFYKQVESSKFSRLYILLKSYNFSDGQSLADNTYIKKPKKPPRSFPINYA